MRACLHVGRRAVAVKPTVVPPVPCVTVGLVRWAAGGPVSMIASFPLLVVVKAESPIKSVQELVAFAKANPAKANYASSSPAFQLPTEQFKQTWG